MTWCCSIGEIIGGSQREERLDILKKRINEMGIDENGVITLIDEIHTPDSSRYFIAEGYQERQDRGEQQKQLSKEFVREWLMENDFMGFEGQAVPDMPDSFVNEVTNRYIGLYEQVTGRPFERAASEHLERDIEEAVAEWIATNNHG